jgi:peroxiredoxin
MSVPLPPEDDGAAAHLVARALPALTLRSTAGEAVDLRALGRPRSVLYLYPMTGRPGVPLPEGWDRIPGAMGCTAEACAFRDHHAELLEAGTNVYGLSSQSTEYQKEAVARLHLPFPLLSDERLALAYALQAPTFTAGGMRLFKRLTMIVAAGIIEHVFYPVFSPEEHAEEVLSWIGRAATPRP